MDAPAIVPRYILCLRDVFEAHLKITTKDAHIYDQLHFFSLRLLTLLNHSSASLFTMTVMRLYIIAFLVLPFSDNELNGSFSPVTNTGVML